MNNSLLPSLVFVCGNLQNYSMLPYWLSFLPPSVCPFRLAISRLPKDAGTRHAGQLVCGDSFELTDITRGKRLKQLLSATLPAYSCFWFKRDCKIQSSPYRNVFINMQIKPTDQQSRLKTMSKQRKILTHFKQIEAE